MCAIRSTDACVWDKQKVIKVAHRSYSWHIEDKLNGLLPQTMASSKESDRGSSVSTTGGAGGGRARRARLWPNPSAAQAACTSTPAWRLLCCGCHALFLAGALAPALAPCSTSGLQLGTLRNIRYLS